MEASGSNDEYELEDLGPQRKRKNTTGRPSIWKYFEKADNGEQYCKFCQAENICTKYSAATSSTNMRRHLEQKHGYSDDYSHGDVSVRDQKKKKVTVSAVWKYFCKPTRQGIVLDEEHVYCGKCLERGTKMRYNRKTSTTTLRRHLRVGHMIDLSDDEDDKRPNISQINIKSVINNDNNLSEDDDGSERKRAKRSMESGGIRKYFKRHSDHSWCVICEKEGNSYKFSQNTSSTILKRHLIVIHQVDPHLESVSDYIHEDDLPSLNLSPDTLAKAHEIINQQLPRPKNYFIKMEEEMDVVYCCFCLVGNRKKGYKQVRYRFWVQNQ